jgi:hypothetical protein
VNIFRARTLALGMLILVFAGCASAGLPTQQNGPASIGASTRNVHPDTACPDSGITFSPGNNGTYSVAVNDSCKLYGPPDIPCNASQSGVKYEFFISSGGSHGTLSGTGQSDGKSLATFRRTSTGDVSIYLNQTRLNYFVSCKPYDGSDYGWVTLE